MQVARKDHDVPVASTSALNALDAMLRPAEIWSLAALLAGYLLFYGWGSTELYYIANLVGPAVLTIILGWSCYRIAERSPMAVWAPLFWFRLASAVYYGFGALVPHVVNDETLYQIYGLYYFDEYTNLKVNIVTSFSLVAVLLTSYVIIRAVRARQVARDAKADSDPSLKRNILTFSLIFLLFGGALRYGLVIPYTFGLTGTVLAGSVSALGNAYYVGIYLLIIYAMNHRRGLLSLVALLVSIEIIISVVSFAKTDLLLILIFSFMGFISNEVSKRRVIIGVSLLFAVYSLFQPLVGYGRGQIALRYGEIRGAGLQERMEIVQGYLGNRDTLATTSQGGLARLSYVNVNAFVIDRYDANQPGSTLRDAAAVFVPRILWPNKPIITDLGSDLNFEVFGRRGSSLGTGLFAEAYWNFGWLGIPPLMIALATILSIFTMVSMRIMARRNWLFLPVVFMGVYMGLRVDGYFVPDVLGSTWIAVVTGFALVIFQNVFRNPEKRGRTVPRPSGQASG